MSSKRRRDRAARNSEWTSWQIEHFETLTEYDRGLTILAMLANALVVTLLGAVIALLVALTAGRSWRNRRLGLAEALRSGPRATLLWAIGAMVVYRQAVNRLALPALERRGLIAPDVSLPRPLERYRLIRRATRNRAARADQGRSGGA